MGDKDKEEYCERKLLGFDDRFKTILQITTNVHITGNVKVHSTLT